MKLEIYGEAKAPVEKVLRLTLKQYVGNPSVFLQAVNEKGIPFANLLSITSDGSLILEKYISKNLGLKLDEDGQLEI